MTATVRAGALIGFIGGLGLLLIWLGLPRHRRAGLAGRVLPYLQDTARPSTLIVGASAAGRHGALGLAASPFLRPLGRGVERLLGGAASIRRRLLRAGRDGDVERFRAEQVLWGAVGGGAALALSVLGLIVGSGSILVTVLVVAIATATGVLARDWWLSHQAREREERMLMEFPTIAELLALSVAAGEGAIAALERVARLSRGELSNELRRCLADARAGANLPDALAGLADRTGLPSLARFVDGIVIAVQRGTPLADVLRAQAQDVRENGRRAVMEEAGRREIAMMIPVVFLILPVTVVFVAFPGLSFLDFTV